MDIQDNVYLTPPDNREDLVRRNVAVCEQIRRGRQWKVWNVECALGNFEKFAILNSIFFN
jgi:hypothetical protein